VMMVFLVLQYNRVIFGYAQAYISPGAIAPDNIIVDPDQTVAVSSEPRLIIPKINRDVPVIYENTMGRNQQETHDKQMAAMEKGVAWFGIDGADSLPGQKGNVVLSGHSSNDWFDYGDLKFVFATLDRLTKDDVIYLNYEGTRYTYQVTGKTVVLPTELSALQLGDSKPMLTLITCTPLGTSEKRLLVFAEQISPDPGTAKSAPSTAPSNTPVEIPGVEPSFLGGLFD
ncbi:sortase, partial [Candidatus Saccharibacteria bacterium]|nr:sortase [Candidatus Saccharibacteria bacterium]